MHTKHICTYTNTHLQSYTYVFNIFIRIHKRWTIATSTGSRKQKAQGVASKAYFPQHNIFFPFHFFPCKYIMHYKINKIQF